MRDARAHPLPWSVPERLLNLRLIDLTGHRNPWMDGQAAKDFGIEITTTGYGSPTIELPKSVTVQLESFSFGVSST
jgi:hypothetical protein